MVTISDTLSTMRNNNQSLHPNHMSAYANYIIESSNCPATNAYGENVVEVRVKETRNESKKHRSSPKQLSNIHNPLPRTVLSPLSSSLSSISSSSLSSPLPLTPSYNVQSLISSQSNIDTSPATQSRLVSLKPSKGFSVSDNVLRVVDIDNLKQLPAQNLHTETAKHAERKRVTTLQNALCQQLLSGKTGFTGASSNDILDFKVAGHIATHPKESRPKKARPKEEKNLIDRSGNHFSEKSVIRENKNKMNKLKMTQSNAVSSSPNSLKHNNLSVRLPPLRLPIAITSISTGTLSSDHLRRSNSTQSIRPSRPTSSTFISPIHQAPKNPSYPHAQPPKSRGRTITPIAPSGSYVNPSQQLSFLKIGDPKSIITRKNNKSLDVSSRDGGRLLTAGADERGTAGMYESTSLNNAAKLRSKKLFVSNSSPPAPASSKDSDPNPKKSTNPIKTKSFKDSPRTSIECTRGSQTERSCQPHPNSRNMTSNKRCVTNGSNRKSVKPGLGDESSDSRLSSALSAAVIPPTAREGKERRRNWVRDGFRGENSRQNDESANKEKTNIFSGNNVNLCEGVDQLSSAKSIPSMSTDLGSCLCVDNPSVKLHTEKNIKVIQTSLKELKGEKQGSVKGGEERMKERTEQIYAKRCDWKDTYNGMTLSLGRMRRSISEQIYTGEYSEDCRSGDVKFGNTIGNDKTYLFGDVGSGGRTASSHSALARRELFRREGNGIKSHQKIDIDTVVLRSVEGSMSTTIKERYANRFKKMQEERRRREAEREEKIEVKVIVGEDDNKVENGDIVRDSRNIHHNKRDRAIFVKKKDGLKTANHNLTAGGVEINRTANQHEGNDEVNETINDDTGSLFNKVDDHSTTAIQVTNSAESSLKSSCFESNYSQPASFGECEFGLESSNSIGWGSATRTGISRMSNLQLISTSGSSRHKSPSWTKPSKQLVPLLHLQTLEEIQNSELLNSSELTTDTSFRAPRSRSHHTFKSPTKTALSNRRSKFSSESALKVAESPSKTRCELSSLCTPRRLETNYGFSGTRERAASSRFYSSDILFAGLSPRPQLKKGDNLVKENVVFASDEISLKEKVYHTQPAIKPSWQNSFPVIQPSTYGKYQHSPTLAKKFGSQFFPPSLPTIERESVHLEKVRESLFEIKNNVNSELSLSLLSDRSASIEPVERKTAQLFTRGGHFFRGVRLSNSAPYGERYPRGIREISKELEEEIKRKFEHPTMNVRAETLFDISTCRSSPLIRPPLSARRHPGSRHRSQGVLKLSAALEGKDRRVSSLQSLAGKSVMHLPREADQRCVDWSSCFDFDSWSD